MTEQHMSHIHETANKENIALYQDQVPTNTKAAMDFLRAALNDTMDTSCDLINNSIISCNESASNSLLSSPIKQQDNYGSNNSSTVVSPVKQGNSFEPSRASLLFRTPDRAKSTLEQLAAVVTSSAITSPEKTKQQNDDHQLGLNKDNNESDANNSNSEQFYDCTSSNNSKGNNDIKDEQHDTSLAEEVSKKLNFLKLESAQDEESVEVSYNSLNRKEQTVSNENQVSYIPKSTLNDDEVINSESDKNNENKINTTSYKDQDLGNCSRLEKIKRRLNANKSRYGGNENSNVQVDVGMNDNKHELNENEMPISNANTAIKAEEVIRNDNSCKPDNSKEMIQNIELKYKTLIEEINKSHQKEVQEAAEHAKRIEQENHNKTMEEVTQKHKQAMQKLTEENNQKIKALQVEHDKIQNSHIMEIDQMAKDIDALELDFNEKTEALQSTVQQKDVAIRELSKQLADMNQNQYLLENRLEDNQDVLNKANQEINILQNHVEELIQTLDNERKEHLKTKKEFEEEKVYAIEKVTSDLKAAAESQFNEANLIYMNLQSDYETMKEEYETLKHSLECERMKVELVEKEKKALEVSKNGITAKLKAASQRYTSEIQQHIDGKTKLEREKDSLIHNLEALQSHLDQMTNLKEEIAKENLELNSICEELMKELEGKQHA